MTFRAGLAHVLRHCWLWPIQFWLRPLDIGDRLAKYGAAEAWAAIAGGGKWGALIGTVIWLATGETQAIWGLAVDFTVAFVVAGASTADDAVMVAVAVAVAVAFAFVVAVAGAFSGAVVYLIIIVSAGIALGIFAPTAVVGVTVLAGILVVGSIIYAMLKNKDISDIIGVILVLVLPAGGWSFLPRISLDIMPVYGFGLVVPFALSCVSVVFLGSDGVFAGRKANNVRKITHAGTVWLAFIWVSGALLALTAWWPDIETAGLNAKLDQLALFLILMPPITTGLPFWPLLAIMAAWQFRNNKARRHNAEIFGRCLPFQWQTFAYPLPGLRRYLRAVLRCQGAQSAFEAIQAVQLGSLQMAKARQAAFDLAENRETALPFCGYAAISANSATLAPFSLAGPTARSVAVLARKPDKEDEQPLRLFVGDYPPKPASRLFPFAKALSNEWVTEFENARASALSDRLKYAIVQLDKLAEIIQGPEFRQLLQAMREYASTNTQNILSLPQLDLLKLKMGEASSAGKHASDAEWLMQGWNVLLSIATILGQFRHYQNLTTVDARRDFLQERTNVLRAVAFDDVSVYWRDIGLELAALWAERLEQEIKQAREWLRLDIQLSQAEFPPGTQILYFNIYNPTRVLAQQLRLIVSNSDGMEWHHREVTRGLLEGGEEARLGLELEARQAGKPYQIPPYQPYVIGEGLGDDRTFVGREDLLHWLRGLWLQPQGKPAVALVGQRRIGKTSLLNKIRRDGLPDTGLLPVLVNVQSVKGDYDFLDSVAREMAEQLGLAKPVLDRANPYPDFKDFLLGLKAGLAGRRFLLMLRPI